MFFYHPYPSHLLCSQVLLSMPTSNLRQPNHIQQFLRDSKFGYHASQSSNASCINSVRLLLFLANAVPKTNTRCATKSTNAFCGKGCEVHIVTPAGCPSHLLCSCPMGLSPPTSSSLGQHGVLGPRPRIRPPNARMVVCSRKCLS